MVTSLNGTPASPLTYGTMQFGSAADEGASHEMFEACRASGITHFDTAWAYTEGRSETLLGRFGKAEREALIIATKVAYSGGAGRENILTSFDESRRRLGMDMVDILYMHRFDDEAPLEETFETLAGLRDEGVIRYIGVSNYAAWQVMKAQAVAARFATTIDVIQPMYSLVKRQAEVEIFPMAQDQSVFIAPYSPLGGGLLTGKYSRGGTGRLLEDARYRARYGLSWMHNVAAELATRAAAQGVHPATLAVAWAASHPAKPAPIISARSAAQLAPSLAALNHTLSPEDRDALTALTPPLAPATDRLEEA